MICINRTIHNSHLHRNKNDEKYEKWIEFKNKVNEKSSDDVKSKINKMDRGLEEDNILSFWGVY